MAGLYIHIPFCHSKCIYCDFFSTPDKRRLSETLETIVKEYEQRKHEIAEPFKTAYLGGGTPSIVPAVELARLCRQLPLSDTIEFTIEANPEDISPELVAAWRDMGINRVSMGIQSFYDTELAAINRRHSADDARRAIDTLLTAGISNISCDLIYGLPGQDAMSWNRSLDELLSYGLPHMSAYCLSYEPGTALHARMISGKTVPASDELIAEMYGILCNSAAAAGYKHYEISNFARPDFRSRHNSSYWDGTPYLGLGPGAHSFDGKTRRYNPSNLKKYIECCPSAIIDEENDDERYNDMLITALRTAEGLDLSKVDQWRKRRLLDDARKFIEVGILSVDGGVMKISESSWLVADTILRQLIIV